MELSSKMQSRKENIISDCKRQHSHIFNIMESGFGMFVSWFFFFFLILAGFPYMYLDQKCIWTIFSFPLLYELPWHSQSCCRTYVYDFSKLFSHWILAICVMGKLINGLFVGEEKFSHILRKFSYMVYVLCPACSFLQHVINQNALLCTAAFPNFCFERTW